MKVTCDKCHKLYKGDIVTENKHVKGELYYVTFLLCPHCNKQTIILVGNEQTEELRKDIKQMFDKYVNTKNETTKRIILTKIERRQKNLEKMSNNLKKHWRNQ